MKFLSPHHSLTVNHPGGVIQFVEGLFETHDKDEQAVLAALPPSQVQTGSAPTEIAPEDTTPEVDPAATVIPDPPEQPKPAAKKVAPAKPVSTSVKGPKLHSGPKTSVSG